MLVVLLINQKDYELYIGNKRCDRHLMSGMARFLSKGIRGILIWFESLIPLLEYRFEENAATA